MLVFVSLHLIPFCELNFNNHNFRICYFCAVLSRFSHVQLFATPWTVACKAPLFMKFSRQEYWNGLPSPSPGDLFNPGVKPESLMSPALQADSLPSEPPEKWYFQQDACQNWPALELLSFWFPLSVESVMYWLIVILRWQFFLLFLIS